MLEDDVGVEPDLIDGRKYSIEYTRSQINKRVGGDECRRDWWFSVKPPVLAHGVHGQDWKQTSTPPPSSLHLLLLLLLLLLYRDGIIEPLQFQAFQVFFDSWLPRKE